MDYILSQRKQIYLITNNSSRTRETIAVEKLEKFNFSGKIPLENIYTSSYVAAQYLIEEGIIKDKDKDKVYTIGEQGMRDEMKRRGITVVNENDPEEKTGMAYDEFADIEVDPDVRAVIVGINFNYNYRK